MEENENQSASMKNDAFSFAVAGVLGIGAFYGKYLQGLTTNGERDYTWLTGHLSDFLAPAAISVALPELAILDASYLTFIELIDKQGVRDPQDIVCYWAGAATGMGLAKLSKRIFLEKQRTLEQKL